MANVPTTASTIRFSKLVRVTIGTGAPPPGPLWHAVVVDDVHELVAQRNVPRLIDKVTSGLPKFRPETVTDWPDVVGVLKCILRLDAGESYVKPIQRVPMTFAVYRSMLMSRPVPIPLTQVTAEVELQIVVVHIVEPMTTVGVVSSDAKLVPST